MSNNILVIDDDIDLCRLIKKYLELEQFNITLKHNGEEGLEEIRREHYHLVVLDVMLPGKNGFDVLNEIRKSNTVPVLMLTAKDSEIDKIYGLRIGADDYLTKPFSMNEFVARVQSIIRRYTTFNDLKDLNQNLYSFGDLLINGSTREVSLKGDKKNLTAKEFDLLYFLIKNKGQVFTKRQIYSRVWQEDYAFDDNNIMVHIRRLRKKIEPNPENPIYVKTIWGVGYKFIDEV